MREIAVYLAIFLALLRPLLFLTALIVAILALTSWAVRTRKISPFSPIARFMRDRIDPWLFLPMERRVIRAGGMPYSAPWWTLAAVVVGGLIFIWLLQGIIGQIVRLDFAASGGPMGIARLLIGWIFAFLRIAIIARVISSWVGGSPYSKWWRWSYVSTEWLIAPLRRVIPTLGPIDISPLAAYFLLYLAESVVRSVI